jgi:lipopolysaccharide/colanic/teichoic acid biosynthesis glycosyltransferase
MIAFAFLAQANYSRVLLLYALAPGAIFPFLLRLLVVRLLPQPVARREEEEISKVAQELIRLSQASSQELDLIEGLGRRKKSARPYLFFKRLLDIGLAFMGLLIVILLYPLIAFFIKRDSSGPVLIAQERVGQNGRPFLFYKFRTMIHDTPLYAPAPKGGEDSRVTSAGRFLRKYSLDELPQLWNVLRGEMSIVGPRPEMPFIAAAHNAWQRQRLSVKPGITGLWQILGRKDLPLSDNLEYDFYYINHRSFLFDLVVIMKTVPAIILGKGAY